MSILFLHIIAEIQWCWWELFAQQLESVVVLVVREFYSNLDENRDSYTAQSCLIPFDPRTINRLFQLPTIDRDEYVNYLNANVNLDQVVEAFCRPRAFWVRKRGVPVRIKGMILTVSSQIWHAFLCARLMQVTRLSDVTKKRALLLYALASGFFVDVGKVIYHSIRCIHRGSTTSGLGQSSLITTLYQHARVEIGLEEKMDGPKSVLNRTSISGFRGHMDGECHKDPIGEEHHD